METLTENLPTLSSLPLNGAAVATINQANPLAMPVSPRYVIERYEAIQEIVRGVFKDGTHFGKIPGTGEKKTLLKPGFDALCTAFQFAPDFVKQPESIESSEFINLVYKCILSSASGRVVATGIGSCNSKEEKYRWINSARKCPSCGKEAISKSKEEWGGGWYCADKKGGCGTKFKKGDRSIEDQEAGRKENDNAWNNHNTLTKMSQKRAGMAAIITACGLSSDFTQDVEDFDLGLDKNPPSGFSDFTPIDIQQNFNSPPPHDQENRWEEIPTTDPELEIESTEEELKRDPDLERVKQDIRKKSRSCYTKEDFAKLTDMMRASAGLYLDKSITTIVNKAYAYRFPKQKTGA